MKRKIGLLRSEDKFAVGFACWKRKKARNNSGLKFTELSHRLERAVATQRSWKNTDDEWASKTGWPRVWVFRPRRAEYVSTTAKKGAHVLVEGSLVSTTYERGNGILTRQGYYIGVVR